VLNFLTKLRDCVIGLVFSFIEKMLAINNLLWIYVILMKPGSAPE